MGPIFLMINSLETGGGERQFVELARSMRANHLQVHLGCLLKKGAFLEGPGGNELWELALLAGSLDWQVAAAVNAQEPAFVAKYAFELAQGFSLFYHHHHVLSETDPERKNFLLQLSRFVELQLVAALDLLGIDAPQKM